MSGGAEGLSIDRQNEHEYTGQAIAWGKHAYRGPSGLSIAFLALMYIAHIAHKYV